MAVQEKRLSRMAMEIEELEKREERDHGQGFAGNGRTLRQRVHLCCSDAKSSRVARLWETTLALLIVLSVIFYAFETYATKPAHRPGLPSQAAFDAGEIFFTLVFFLELVVRGIAAPTWFTRPDPPPGLSQVGSPRSTMSSAAEVGATDDETPFFLDLLNYLDFVAILPLPLQLILNPETNPENLNLEFEIIKLLRVLRIFKIFRSFSGTRILMETAAKSIKPLSLTLMMLFMFFTVVASLTFMVEPCADEGCVFKDAFNTGYYLAITLTTVGYGDQVPTHPFGRFLAVVTMLFGAVFLSMPIAVIGNKFELSYEAFEKREAHKNPKLALETAKKEYQARLDTRRKRVSRGLFSMLYDIKRVESILEATAGTSPAKPAAKEEETEGKDKSKYAVSGASVFGMTAHELASAQSRGPASHALVQLSRKHHFIKLDVRQLFRTQALDENLPTHIQTLMHKITQTSELAAANQALEEADAQRRSKLKEQGLDPDHEDDDATTRMTHANSKGIRAFDLVEKKDKLHLQQANVRRARERGGCRNNLWLVLEIHGSSRFAYYVYMFRWLMLALSVGVMMLSTFPEFHEYREDSTYCQRIVATYCAKIEASTSPNKAAWKAANPGCFKQSLAELRALGRPGINITADKDYGGCLDHNDCDWPSAAHGMTCASLADGSPTGALFSGCDVTPAGVPDVVTAVADGKADDAFKLLNDARDAFVKANNGSACTPRTEYADSIYSLLMEKTPVCQRTPCVDNVPKSRGGSVESYTGGASSGEYSSVWASVELIFTIYFVTEYLLRVLAARDFKTFCRSHVANFIFTILLVVEYASVISYRNGFRYDAWGFGSLDSIWDPHRLRPLRIIVPIRFCAFSSDFRGIRVAILTIERVAGRMMTPALFFGVFMVLFGGMMYVFELLECKAMPVPDDSGDLKWFYVTKSSTGIDDWSGCMVQDMFDAMWIIIVT